MIFAITPTSKFKTATTTLALAASVVAAGLDARAAVGTMPGKGGDMQVEMDGRTISLPLLKSDYSVEIAGDVATVTLRQTFANPGNRPVDATYLFPLNRKAAVYGMDMRVGDDIVRAVIQEKSKAQATFDKAKESGKQAALLTQHRPNMFTQSIANLMPGAPVEITLRYVQTVPKVDDAYEIVIPMIVGPRYEGALAPTTVSHDGYGSYGSDEPSDKEQIDGWSIDRLPAYPPVIGQNAPATIDDERVSLKVDLTAPTGVEHLTSSSHAIDVTGDATAKTIALSEGRAIDNRDFVLRYTLGDDTKIAAGALAHYDDRGGFVSIMLEPPKVPMDEMVARRELVFVLDTSGSMGGEPMEASRTFMRAALKGLRPTDRFRILSFSNTTAHMASSALPATAGNVRRGLRYVDSLRAAGGTEMNAAMHNAFDTPGTDGTARIVVFLTDGYIGADRNVITTVANRIGNSRLYAFGVGRSVNRFLLEGIAEEGRGYARYVEPGESHMEAAEQFARDLKTPVLTDIVIDWNGLEISGQTPQRPKDLFAGGSLRVAARYRTGGKHTIFVEGLVQGRKARLPIEIDLPTGESGSSLSVQESAETETKSHPLPLIWARERIAQLNREYTVAGGTTLLKERITRLGLDFSLQSRFTSFVAVHEKVVNSDRSDTVEQQVPLPPASGVSPQAYPENEATPAHKRASPAAPLQQMASLPGRSTGMSFTPSAASPTLALGGSSTPEPEGLLAIMMLLTLAMMRWWRKVRTVASTWYGRIVPRRLRRRKTATGIVPTNLERDGWWLEETKWKPGQRRA